MCKSGVAEAIIRVGVNVTETFRGNTHTIALVRHQLMAIIIMQVHAYSAPAALHLPHARDIGQRHKALHLDAKHYDPHCGACA